MEAEDIIPLPASCSSDDESDKGESDKLSHEVGATGVQGHALVDQDRVQCMNDAEVEEGQLVSMTDGNEDVVGDKSCMEERVGFVDAAATGISDLAASHGENGTVKDNDVEEGQLISGVDPDENTVLGSSSLQDVSEAGVKAVDEAFENGCMVEHPEIDGGSAISGSKRSRTIFEEQQTSVHVKYYGLSRESKQKLEELLREWSRWHARNSRRTHDQHGLAESGEDIYFPALDICTGNSSAVTFWMENETRKPDTDDFLPVEDACVPLYDREFALGSVSADGLSNLEGGLELLDAPRCFNCSSYSHSLKECSKPRDNAAVNNSRKQLKSKRNQTANIRNVSRYYQDSPGGKYEGLRPGILDAETRRLLGLGETDPPPWLNRMREIGYPPGYLDPDDENLPSGITIFADEEIRAETEEGEILDAGTGDIPRKKSVMFPGINAPIPENAHERAWAVRPSNSDRQRNGDSGRSSHSSESYSRGRYRAHHNRDFKDEDPFDFDRPSRSSSKYYEYDYNSISRSSRENSSTPRSPSYGRSLGEKGRTDPLDAEDAVAYRAYSSFSYNSTRRSEHADAEVSRDDHSDYSSRNRDRDDRQRHRGGR